MEFSQFYLLIRDIGGLTLEGETDARGRPATELVGWYGGSVHQIEPPIMWCERCDSLTLLNLSFGRDPEYGSSGTVIRTTNSTVDVQVFSDAAFADGMGAFCANRFAIDDENAPRLVGESVSYGGGTGSTWQLLSDRDRTLRIQSAQIAKSVHTGDGLSWHNGARNNFQVALFECNDLTLDNLWTWNSAGFGLITSYCRNIFATGVHFAPKGNRLFTGPRDAWKIHRCPGLIRVSDLSVTGVRMDGQNMHSTWLTIDKINGDMIRVSMASSPTPIVAHSRLEFYAGDTVEHREISEATWSVSGPALSHSPGDRGSSTAHGGMDVTTYEVRLASPPPLWAKPGGLVLASDWEPDAYICTDSSFTNVAGAGHLVRYDNVTIERCTYAHMMNPGILLGAEEPGHLEGGHATRIRINESTFVDCGKTARYGALGAVAIRSAHETLPLNRDIAIEGCTFEDCDAGISIATATEVTARGNVFRNVGNYYTVDSATTVGDSLTLEET